MKTDTLEMNLKMLDLNLPSAYFAPNPHADFVTIHGKGAREDRV